MHPGLGEIFRSKKYLLRLAAGFAAAFLALAVFHWLIAGPFIGPAVRLDQCARDLFSEHGTDLLTALFLFITRLGSTIFLTVVGAAACVVFIWYGRRRELLLYAIATAGQIVLHNSAKAIFHRPRPELLFRYHEVGGYSYPSGHAFSSFCLYIVLAWLFAGRSADRRVRRALLIAAASLVLLIGMSRVYIGMHYLTDVIAAYIAAAIWTAAVLYGTTRPEVKRKSPATLDADH